MCGYSRGMLVSLRLKSDFVGNGRLFLVGANFHGGRIHILLQFSAHQWKHKSPLIFTLLFYLYASMPLLNPAPPKKKHTKKTENTCNKTAAFPFFHLNSTFIQGHDSSMYHRHPKPSPYQRPFQSPLCMAKGMVIAR